MINIVSVLIFLGTVFLIYRFILKKSRSRALSRRDYLLTLLSGALPCTVCIAICEILFDRFCLKQDGTLLREILTAFLRAALIEELFKLIFSITAVRKRTPATRTEYMLLCGLIGAGYGLVEKIAYGGGIILIVNAVLPLHVFFQFVTGAYLYRSFNTEAGGRRRNILLAFAVPFVLHGLWDSLLAAIGYLMEDRMGFALNSVGLVLFIALLAGGLIAEVRTVRRMAAEAETEG